MPSRNEVRLRVLEARRGWRSYLAQGELSQGAADGLIAELRTNPAAFNELPEWLLDDVIAALRLAERDRIQCLVSSPTLRR